MGLENWAFLPSYFAWSDARSIAPPVAGVLFVTFLPPRIVKLRVVFISAIHSGTLDAAYLVMGYYVSASHLSISPHLSISLYHHPSLGPCISGLTYASFKKLPTWFQAVKGVSTLDSGYRVPPLLAANIVCNFSAATLAGKLHYDNPFMIIGSITLTFVTGLLTTLTPWSSVPK